ncbi:glycosyltransferase family 39 protein [Geodermatophilus sp. DSM 44513]|uniref:glycosyltransferase family 39 protein n=1 Tax=Geodermatophilus sp. DSM 44513 TaxID=1528104 RepID=UPI00141346A6|nr:glycosyltransferase family 39 protein [Geodermatophilus sp. DSM 44513]WNV74563.1 glycosyltransferase family 39 protein [Geodermatophilus sp. DSM 44513]
MTAGTEGAQATRVRPAPARPDRRPGLWTRLGERSGQPWPLAVLATVLAGCVAVGVLARFVAPPELWLDEAQSVAIARLPLPELVTALEQDGSPPLYYLLLHGWTSLFGTSATAVRALSAVIGVLTLPLAWYVARRLAGRRTAVALVVLLATSPFLIRYSSETRMYALLVLLTVLGAAAGAAVLRRPGPGPVLGLGVVTGALLLTHVWAFHVVAVTGLLALAALRSRRAVALRVLAALAVGGLLFSPWLLSLFVQLAHTGTPWAAPPAFAVLPMALEAWRGGSQVRDHVLGTALLLLATVGLLAAPTTRRPGARTVLLALPPRPSRAVLLALSLGTLLVAGAVSALTGTAVADRYTSVAVLAFLTLVALGVAALPGVALRATGLLLVAGLGLASALPGLTDARTQAGEVAQALEDAAPGDVVVFCPDQLGPGVTRLVPPEQRLDLVVYPDLRPADRVDWTDYAERVTSMSSAAVAADVLQRAGDSSGVWVVTGPGYRVPSGQRCDGLVDALERARGEAEPVVTPDPRPEENHRLEYLAPVAD